MVAPLAPLQLVAGYPAALRVAFVNDDRRLLFLLLLALRVVCHSSTSIRRPALLFGNEPKLLQEAQIIVTIPVLDYLAPFDAADGDAFALYLPPGGRAKLLYLSLV